MDYRTPNIYDPSTLTEPYAYARANPVMFWDPDGLKEISYRIGNTNYILDIDDETWAAILHGELTFAGITLFDPLAPVTPQWVMHHSVGEDFPDMEMTNREEVKRYKKELQSREAKQLAFIQAFMPRHTNTVFPWILKDVLKSLNESDAQGRGAIYRALYQAGMLHQVNVANGFGRDFAQEAALALVGPQITHYKRFGFWQDLEVAGWVVTAGDAGWILKGLIRPSKTLLSLSKGGYQTKVVSGRIYELRPSNGGSGPNRWFRVTPVRKAASQNHHLISSPIVKALERAGLSRETALALRNNPALQKMSAPGGHVGYEKWHRDYDRHMVKWITDQGKGFRITDFFDEISRYYQSGEASLRIPGVNLGHPQ